MRNKIYIVLLLGFYTSLYSQNQTDTSKIDSRFRGNDDKVMDEITIHGFETNLPSFQTSEVANGIIYSGKKNELILVGNLNANTALNNTRQIFGKVAGVHIWENDGSGLQVGVATRGLSPNRSWEFNCRQNGYDVSPDAFGYPEAYYCPPMQAVAKIEIIRGAAGLQFGPQFGGLLNCVIKSAPMDKKFEFETEQTAGCFGTFNTFNSVGGTIKKRFSYYGYVNYRRSDGWRKNSEYNVLSSHLNVSYKITDKIKMSSEVSSYSFVNQQSGGLTDGQFGADARQSFRGRNWFNAPFIIGNFNMIYQIKANSSLNVNVFGLIGERNSVGFLGSILTRDSINLGTNEFNNRQLDRDYYKNYGLEVRYVTSYQLFKQKSTLAAGIRYYKGNINRLQQGKGTVGSDFDLTEMGVYSRDLAYNTQNIAVYVENIFKWGSKLSFTPGVRYENIASTSAGRLNFASNGTENLIKEQYQRRSFFLLGMGMEYKTTSQSTIYANISQAYRPVLYADITPSATTDSIDPNLKDATGYNADAGFRGSYKNIISWDVNGFYLSYDNRVGTLSTGISGRQYRTNINASASSGIESFIEISPIKLCKEVSKIGSVSVYASVSYINAVYKGTLQKEGYAATNLDGKKVENAPQVIQRYGITYSIAGFSTTFQISNVGSCYSDVLNTEIPTSNGNTGLIPAYQVMDWSATYRFLKRYSLKVGVNNLSDSRYFTRRTGGYPGPGLIPGEGRSFYVTVGVKF